MVLASRLVKGRLQLRRLTIVTAFALALLGMLVMPGVALAEAPFRLDSQIEDRAGALSGRTEEVRAALDDLRASEGIDLWVVYVETFSGLDAEEWALETADRSDLGLNDALLAVAVDDRNYYYVVDEDFPLNNDEMNDVMVRSVEPALHDDDWAGAAVGAAAGIAETLSPVVVTTVTTNPPATGTTTAGTSGGSGGTAENGEEAVDGGFPWGVLIALIVLAIVGVIIWARLWNSRKGSRSGKGNAAGGDAVRGMTLQELRQRVGSQLVQTDDAIKTSTEEVGFAIAEFGEAEAAPFEKALEEAHRELDEAFKLHRQLDENADEQTQRLLLTAILQHTGAANAVLDAQVKHFDKLRDLEKQAPQVLAALEQQVTALEARIPGVRDELAALAAVYSPNALKSVTSSPDEAASRLVFVREQMKAGLEDVAAKRLGEAAVTALAAQEAAGQAQAFLDAVGRIGKDLAEAQGRIDAAVAETQRDIAEAQAAGAAGSMGPAAAQLGPLVATAQAAVAAASGAASPEGGRDPLTALRHLEEADAALDSALQQVRDERAQRAKAAVALDRTLIAARAQVSAAADYITTHRGAVGAQPRELLAEAQGALDQALALGTADPVGATRWASSAHELAGRALNMAASETQRATTVGIPGMPGAPGTDMGSAVIGAILGGILTSALGGGSSGRRGGSIFGSGWSGGSSGGRRGGGGFAPPSFGGTGTRMRRGGGGRF